MNKFMLNITASSGEFYQGDCEDLVLPTGDGVYGVQAGHNPVLVALHMGLMHFTVNGEEHEVLVGDGIATALAGKILGAKLEDNDVQSSMIDSMIDDLGAKK